MRILFRNVRGAKRQSAIQQLNSIARKEIERVLDEKVKPAVVKSHEIIVADWISDVGFAARRFIKPDYMAINVFPTGADKEIWFYVNDGVRPHPMPAVSGKLMVFQAGGKYNPKTSANPARFGGSGKVTGGTKVFATSRKAYMHPGNKPRNFTKTIAEDIKPSFKKEIENAFRRVSNKVKE